MHTLRRIGEFLAGRLALMLLLLMVLTGSAYVLRMPLLRAIGHFLVRTDVRDTYDAAYVLGGSAPERGEAGGRMLREGKVPVVYCTGEAVHRALEVVGLPVTEAELTRRVALRFAGPDSASVRTLPIGTSTWEEAGAVIAHAREQGHAHIAIVTTEFHTRRVRRVFRNHAEGTPVQVHVVAAPASVYDSERWWESEEGLLMVNNEYVKLLYYMLRY